MLPNYVKKGQPITAENMNKAVVGIRSLGNSILSVGKMPKSTSLGESSSSVDSDLKMSQLKKELESEMLWDRMPFQLFIETTEKYCICNPYNDTTEYYYKVGIINGFVRYQIVESPRVTYGNPGCYQAYLKVSEFVYEKTVQRGIVMHTFGSEHSFYLTPDWISVKGGNYGELCNPVYSAAVSIGLTYQMTEYDSSKIQTILAFSSERDLEFPEIYAKEGESENKYRLDFPIGVIDVEVCWWYKQKRNLVGLIDVGYLRRTEAGDNSTETELKIVSKKARHYYRGNIDSTIIISKCVKYEEFESQRTVSYRPVELIPDECGDFYAIKNEEYGIVREWAPSIQICVYCNE